ncbi:c-type cytochrome [Spirosoma pollinicola]|uniref:Cytochrome C n=1 Tax=Spirosoma pollinicola TaxID=2057025 RepID=A0A2K8YT13_9BACT|nr:c-type cytochrome [Spirosoma pollinicola]AUD00765.1 cytochrome C [Spirosoma pollinicola]
MKKRIGKIVLSVLGAFILLVILCAVYLKLALPGVEAAPEMAIKPTAAQIEHGSYLANHVASCMHCHSSRDFSKLTGPNVAGTEGKGGEGFLREMGFPGNYYAQNLTPAYLSDWTDGEIYRAITAGVSRDGHALFPVMPYLSYAKMDPADIKDIIAYLRTLKPIDNVIPAAESDFPMNFIINTMPVKPEGGKLPDTTDPVAYGKYITTFAACADCHTPVDGQGKALPGMDFAGGREFPVPTGTVRSMNITADKSGIGSWTKETFVRRFKAYEHKEQPAVQAGEFNTVMPWTVLSGMTESDLGAVYDYLRTLKPVEHKVERFTPATKLVANR